MPGLLRDLRPISGPRSATNLPPPAAYLAGWKHHDLGQEGAAQRYYLLGYQLAYEADPHE
ncbi:MAG: hypothetical protein ACR2GH_06645 [Pseudonocardia sp.]